MADTAALWALPDPSIVEALRVLGKRRFALAIHDASFPGATDEDIGRGTPYSAESKVFFKFARHLGFDTIQLGPQGQTTADNPSPYDGTLLSRNTQNLALLDCAAPAAAESPWRGLLSKETLHRLIAQRPAGALHNSEQAYAFAAAQQALQEMYNRFAAARAAQADWALALSAELAHFCKQEQDWLQADALYFCLAEQHGWSHHRDWPVLDPDCPDRALYCHVAGEDKRCRRRLVELQRRYASEVERYALGQFVLGRQHQRLRHELAQGDLRLYGDLQIGMSPCDEWSRGMLYLDNYHMGAPPSRTNPAGQPWGYGVADPAQYRSADGQPGPVIRLLQLRITRMLADYNGLRIDHPHGLVSPWVYSAQHADPQQAVQNGARLFSSPDLADHPELAAYAIARPDQLNTDVPRHADDWVQSLDSAQIDRYGVLLDLLVDQVVESGGERRDVICEVLSTLPYPLARVMARQGLGRFRVTQKADLDNPDDVYRSENAQPEDWIMVGNHDTAPIWRLAGDWLDAGQVAQRAAYLALRLVAPARQASFARQLAADKNKLVHACMADIFLSRAGQVMIFFPDLLGMQVSYNLPGVTSADNWRLRVPPAYESDYNQAVTHGSALNIPRVLNLALRARSLSDGDTAPQTLIDRLDQLAGWWPQNSDT